VRAEGRFGGSGAELPDRVTKLGSVERRLPELLARAATACTPLSVVVVRPGPAAPYASVSGAPRRRLGDLATALSETLGPDQALLRAGPRHLAVVVPGTPRAAKRQVLRLMERAARAGAPQCVWSVARYPSEATTATGLMDLGRRRVETTVSERSAVTGAPIGSDRHGRAAAAWAGVAAAVLVGALAYTVHDPRAAGANPGSHATSVTGQADQTGPGASPCTGLLSMTCTVHGVPATR
jgi:hypothetical protein